ncbi:MAG: hypothetical protein IT245_00855 [Bacteroidia bacterium]|nr:hypothetical protein [Bacteroidia bacterium]
MKIKTHFKFLLLTSCLFNFSHIYAQGCSDAGLCTAGGMKHDNTPENGSTLTLNNQLGSGEQGVSIFSTQIEYRQVFKNKWAVQAKLPWIFTSGNLGQFNGIGDLTLIGSYLNLIEKDWKLNVNFGFKLPSGSTSANYSVVMTAGPAYSLPMPYQTGLGTFDFLIGADIRNNKGWLFAAGIQIPLIQNNKNRFDTSISLLNNDARAYFSSSQLIRRPDIVARIEKQFKLNDNASLQIGFIPIYHLGNDRYIQLNNQKEITLEGSSGLTLNFGGGIQYKVNDHFGLSVKYAMPLMVRKVRPDGLTRAFVAGLELAYKF